MRRRIAAILALLLAVLPLAAHADPIDDGVRRIGLQLQCPVCEGESVADSPSGLAGDMRAVIRAKLAQAEPDQQILEDFVASYGDSILTEPPKRGISLGVWVGPIVGLALGALLLGLLLRTWRRTPPLMSAASSTASVDADVSEELQRFRREFGR